MMKSYGGGATGLAGSSSEYLLSTLCETTRQEAYTDPFKYSITRSDERNQELIDERTQNDNSDTYKTLVHNSKGVKADSFIKNTPHIDTLHCEINSAVWLKKIYVWEISGSLHWAKKDHVNELKHAEELFDKKPRQKCGLQRWLMQPGNYSRKLLSNKCTAVVMSLVKEESRPVVQELTDWCRKLKKVWKSTRPLESCPSDVRVYRENASAFMDTIKTHFNYVRDNIPNYVHKFFAHVPQLIDLFGSTGAFSSEANEHGNKLLRSFRKMCARQNTKFELADILKFHWLYTMKTLQEQIKSQKAHSSVTFAKLHAKKLTLTHSSIPSLGVMKGTKS